MLHVVIVGAGPAGFYTAEALVRRRGAGVAIDVIDALPTPYGLIRAGVAPDHQSIKAVDKRYHAVLAGGVRFVGDVTVGGDVAVAELLDLYDAVVIATGAPRDRGLGIPGDDLPGVLGAAAFVGWYNGHPDHAGRSVPLHHPGVAVVGNGNVAIDVARVLAKTPAELAATDIAAPARAVLAVSAVRTIHVIGRRGPRQASFTPKEVGELGHLAQAQPYVASDDLPDPAGDAALEPGLRKVVGYLRAFANAPPTGMPVTIAFDFFTRPTAIQKNGDALRLTVERTRLDGDAVVGTGDLRTIDCGLVVAAIGYSGVALDGVPFDAAARRVSHDGGRVAERLYVTGWARRGPSGTIGTNKADGTEIAERIAADVVPAGRIGAAGLDALLGMRGVRPVGFAGWQAIDAAELAAALPGAPREKMVARAALRAVAHSRLDGCAPPVASL